MLQGERENLGASIRSNPGGSEEETGKGKAFQANQLALRIRERDEKASRKSPSEPKATALQFTRKIL